MSAAPRNQRKTAKKRTTAPAKTVAKTSKAKSKKAQTMGVKYRSFKLERRIKRDNSDVLPVWKLIGRTYSLLVGHWRKFAVIFVIYGVLYALFVRSQLAVDLNEYRDLVSGGNDDTDTLTTFILAGVAFAASAPSSDVQQVYGGVLLTVFSLIIIWCLRHILAGKDFKVKDALYQSTTPLVPYVLVVLVMFIQLLPFALGGLLFALVNQNNIAVTGVETMLFGLVWAGLTILSAYWLSNSIMSLYAVTLSGMTPLQALRATKKIVEHRRWMVARKIVFLPLILAAFYLVLTLAVITVSPNAYRWVLDISAVGLPFVVHTYLYQLYRSLI